MEYEKVIDVVDAVNNGEKVLEIAKKLGISKDTFSRRLSEVGYKFNNSLKIYEYLGEASEKEKVNVRKSSEIFQKKVRKNSVKVQKEVGQKEEKVQKEVGQKEEKVQKSFGRREEKNVEKEIKVNNLSFSEDEIKALKKLIKIQQSDESKILFDLMELPFSGKTIKKTVLVSGDLFGEFEKFAEKITVNNKLITKNMLIELALFDFMTKYNKN
ncbi:hypothetical protein PDK22_27150 [Bacillus cereus group sp. BY122LC]|uniref:hypothetical protein n=1 Tax=Bacillus cereus group TaxID=86661 RepID=UPI0022E417E3|nr:hypothetical protein [Bacillus cereus group sp. BY122LC]MDA1861357.1 hypothetical protein [Bacillus cereus group sp. BY122LC]